MCVSLDFFVQVIPNYLKPKSNCLSIFKDEGWYGIDLKFVHIWCWSNVHDISQTSRETLGNGTVACCKAKSCSDGRGAPKAPRCPFCAWARTGWGDWIRLNIFVMVVISRVDRFEVVKTLVLGDCPHTPWAVKGYKQGRPFISIFKRGELDPEPWYLPHLGDGRPLSPRWDTWSFVVLPKWTPTTSGAPLSFWRIWAQK